VLRSLTVTAIYFAVVAFGLGVITPTLAKPKTSVLGEITLTAGEKSVFFTEVLIPLGGDPNVDYGVYAQGYGDIGGDSQAGNAGGYVHFSQVPIDQCGVTSFFGVTQASQATARFRLFCKF